MADEGDIFKLVTETPNGNNFGGNTRVTNRVVAKPKTYNGYSLINVLDYKIFANEMNETLREKLPFIYIEEYSLISNSLINQFRYFGDIIRYDEVVAGIKQTAGIVAGAVSTNPDGTKTSVESVFGSVLGWLGGAVGNIVGGTVNTIDSALGVSDLANSAANAINPEKILPYITPTVSESTFNSQLIGQSLQPYNGLYQTTPTGFKYIMPYFEDKNYDINNKFVDNFTGFMGVETQPMKYLPNVFKAGADMVKSVGEAFLSMPASIGGGGAYNSPSTYVEVPQYFAAGEYDSYTVKFDLLNTFNVKDVQKNYDLLFLLAFQNLPFREDIVKIVPPKLYTLLIPGQIFLPYCHIKSIKIDYIGNRRQLELYKFNYHNISENELPKDKQLVIVPDCYKVTIEFLSMVKPASNFMLVPNIRANRSNIPLINAAEITSPEKPIPKTQPTPAAPAPATQPTPAGSRGRTDIYDPTELLTGGIRVS
jgi:hypothetical protein